MREIPLTQGKVALVDDEDFERLNQYKWCASKGVNTFYAFRRISRKIKKNRMVMMHRFLKPTPAGLQIDHIDRNGLNNQKSNLRIVTARQNQQNLAKPKSSEYTGVCWNKHAKKWMAHFCFKGRVRHLGYFKNEEDAGVTYLVACAVLCDEGAV